MCLGGHLAFRVSNKHLYRSIQTYYNWCPIKAAFDARVLASVCFFATDIHSATLGKGKKDDSLERVRKGDLTGKGELVVGRPILH
jgi:carboxymethylenebutenolidase